MRLLTPAAVVAVALGLAAGGSSGSADVEHPWTWSPSKSVDGVGKVLVDANGMALYSSNLDASGKPACAGACTAIWKRSRSPPARRRRPAASGRSARTRSDGRGRSWSAASRVHVRRGRAGKVTGNGASDAFAGKHFTWTAATAGGSAGSGGSAGRPAATPAGAHTDEEHPDGMDTLSDEALLAGLASGDPDDAAAFVRRSSAGCTDSPGRSCATRISPTRSPRRRSCAPGATPPATTRAVAAWPPGCSRSRGTSRSTGRGCGASRPPIPRSSPRGWMSPGRARCPTWGSASACGSRSARSRRSSGGRSCSPSTPAGRRARSRRSTTCRSGP